MASSLLCRKCLSFGVAVSGVGPFMTRQLGTNATDATFKHVKQDMNDVTSIVVIALAVSALIIFICMFVMLLRHNRLSSGRGAGTSGGSAAVANQPKREGEDEEAPNEGWCSAKYSVELMVIAGEKMPTFWHILILHRRALSFNVLLST